MIKIIQHIQIKFILVFLLLAAFMSTASSQSQDVAKMPGIYKLSGIKNNHFVTKLSENWEIMNSQHNLSATIDLPLLAPPEFDQITYIKSFQIPDSLRTRKLVIWFPRISGIALININNIQIGERLNLNSGFKIEIPMNLLNISGDNTLDIQIRKPERVDEGIPNLVRVFKPQSNLGIAGDIYLEWLPHAYFEDFKYSYHTNKLSFKYNLTIDERFSRNQQVNPKVFCQEVIKDSQNRIIFSRFEYIDLKTMSKNFTRSTYIENPLPWSPDSVQFYTLTLTAKSGTGLIAYHEQKIGLRDISFVDQQLRINGTPILLNGINYRIEFPVYDKLSGLENHPEKFIETLREDFIDIKQLGFNAIRFPNKTPHPFCFYLADSLGLYILSETGLWRVPENYFREDHLLQLSKKVADDIITLYAQHCSFIALGIGNEVPIHMASVKKYMLILKGYIEQKSSLALYLSPLNLDLISQRPITDFYLCSKYDRSLLTDFDQIVNADIYQQGASLIFGNVGFSTKEIFYTDNDQDYEEKHSARVQKFLELAHSQKNYGGFFLESYRDWSADSPARVGQLGLSGLHVYPYGLITSDQHKRVLYNKISPLLNGDYPVSVIDRIPAKKSNFFSITVFIFSVIIIFIYRRNYRFRENLKRSMAHPYGFFVDLRDRRIISILNSTIIGLYTNFLVTTLIAAYIYFMRDNLLIEEVISSVLVPLNAKSFYLELMDSPLFISVAIWLVFYLLQLTIVILLKIINLLATEKIRFKQYLAVCNWAGAPLFLLFPVSLLSYHLMRYEISRPLIILLLLLFFFWYNFRLGNGLRVLLSMRIYKIVLLLIFVYGGVLFAFGAIYESNYGLLTYFKLLMDASPLF